MRSFEERKEEIFRRSEKRIIQRKKNIKRVVLSCVPLMLCVTVVSGYLTLGGFGRFDNAAPESAGMEPNYGMIADSNEAICDCPEEYVVQGSKENLPESADEDGNKTNCPENESVASEGERRPLYEDEVIKLATSQVDWAYDTVTLEPPPESGGWKLASGDWTVIFWSENRETFQVVLVGRYGGVQLVQPPANQKEAIAIADSYKLIDYYSATAEQDPETGEWTVTFWSRNRETYQIVIVSKYGCILRATGERTWVQDP